MISQHFWLNRKLGRYYKIFVHKDMLNDLILTCVWGSMNSNLGNYSHTLIKNLDEAKEFIVIMEKKRFKRGYQLIKAS